MKIITRIRILKLVIFFGIGIVFFFYGTTQTFSSSHWDQAYNCSATCNGEFIADRGCAEWDTSGDLCDNGDNVCLRCNECPDPTPTPEQCTELETIGGTCAGCLGCELMSGHTFNTSTCSCDYGPPVAVPGGACTYLCDEPPTSTPVPATPTTPIFFTPIPTTPIDRPPTLTPTVPIGNPTPTKTPTPTATATPTNTPTPTPTPDPFDESQCGCDGLSYAPSIGLGQATTVTAFGKVDGINTRYAKITGFDFIFYKGDDVEAIVASRDRVPSILIEDTLSLDRYKAEWVLDVPADLDTSFTYRLQAVPICERQTAFNFSSQNSVVLAESDVNLSLFDRIFSFFSNLFGRGESARTQIQDDIQSVPAIEVKKNIQLDEFVPGTQEDTNNCSWIRFKFGEEINL